MNTPKEHSCPYCHASATLGAVYYDQNCAGCVKRMSAQQPVSMEPKQQVKETPVHKIDGADWPEPDSGFAKLEAL